jgi:geranylgeranylglycerol-phosphate geranylgeranyltransferase
MIGLIRIVRLRATSSAPALTLIGWIDVGRPELPGINEVACSLVSSFALMAFAQVFNDIMDRALDAKAKPDRPIPAGVISVPQAAAMATALALVTIGMAALTSLATFCYAIFGLTLSILYSTRLKNTVLLGNLTVALVSCTMFSYGSVTISRPWGRELVGTTMIFLYVFGNELFKTTLDLSEDAKHGLRTIATVHGGLFREGTNRLAVTACQ